MLTRRFLLLKRTYTGSLARLSTIVMVAMKLVPAHVCMCMCVLHGLPTLWLAHSVALTLTRYLRTFLRPQHNIAIDGGIREEPDVVAEDVDGTYERAENSSKPRRADHRGLVQPLSLTTVLTSSDPLGDGTPAWMDSAEPESKPDEEYAKALNSMKRNPKYAVEVCHPRAVVTDQMKSWGVTRPAPK